MLIARPGKAKRAGCVQAQGLSLGEEGTKSLRKLRKKFEDYTFILAERLDASELNLSEDSTAYTKKEFYELLKRIHEGSKATCGLKLVTLCYGIIGFLKFLGPYYKLVITERREICKVSKSTRDSFVWWTLQKTSL
ncbi:hypothetical protein Bca101_027011 [Brassica carinata]